MKNNNTIVCRCEEVTLEQINKVLQEQHCSAREIKLRTRAGMGCCGGRTCRTIIDQIVELNEAPSKCDEINLSYRPPSRPVTFGELEDDNNGI
ncbi:(2Fe-2S)-binding protein [Staphylococcus gallinarum]|uniref:(2Fe-2S)-binding protein n=1 Tax=Staphylococcus gallinarum TaxID=1293 RepID=UPI001E2D251C|nr:(2Fe-2S)-binding protein [Staphylococcus gallinarum]MCD8909446.1 (2Fe-2S)-binding protein [Staphylococcus gallinarum]MCD8919965.1 (2Fe-2S)-binding protein [Staphylococcus gallinarum]UEH00257.1 (2Fe-2S)-binding protein [Staphylococcus gallinarum]